MKLLATSREALRLQAEQRYEVGTLGVSAAGALFVARARSNDRGFELNEANGNAVAAICAGSTASLWQSSWPPRERRYLRLRSWMPRSRRRSAC